MKITLLFPIVVASLFAPAVALAQSPAYYVATPVAAPVQPSVVTRSTLWRARGPIFFAQRAPERPVILCRMLADRAGPIAGFAAGGKPLGADDLAACNAKVAPEAVAAK